MRPRKWQAPLENMVKINIDASIFTDQGEFGIGIVIRDFRGHVLAARLQRYPGDIDAKHAETIAAKEGLLMA